MYCISDFYMSADNLKELLEAINLDKKKMGNDLNIIVLKDLFYKNYFYNFFIPN